jgi:ribose 5-phosphate isomerase
MNLNDDQDLHENKWATPLPIAIRIQHDFVGLGTGSTTAFTQFKRSENGAEI